MKTENAPPSLLLWRRCRSCPRSGSIIACDNHERRMRRTDAPLHKKYTLYRKVFIMNYTSIVDRVFVFTVIRSPHPPFAPQIVPLLHRRRLCRAFDDDLVNFPTNSNLKVQIDSCVCVWDKYDTYGLVFITNNGAVYLLELDKYTILRKYSKMG